MQAGNLLKEASQQNTGVVRPPITPKRETSVFDLSTTGCPFGGFDGLETMRSNQMMRRRDDDEVRQDQLRT